MLLLTLRSFPQAATADSTNYATTATKQFLTEADPDFKVTLVSNDEVEFSWNPIQGDRADQFEIEYSTDAIHFSELRKVDPQEHNGSGAYRIVIRKENAGTTYYRLQKSTVDGDSYYSKIVAIVSEESPEQISIFPNPSVGNVINLRILSSDYNQPASIRITGRSGRTIFSTTVAGSLEQQLMLEQGYYVLVLTEGNGNLITRKIVVN
jgi:hypothetical protein